MSYELAKDVVSIIGKVIKNVKDADLKSDLNEIQSNIFTMQQDMFEMQNVNNELRKQIADFNDIKDIEKRIKRNKGTVAEYTDENGNQFDICIICWDKDRKIMHSCHNILNRCSVCATALCKLK